ELDGLHFRVVEYKPEARSLRDLLGRNGWLALDKACDIADQISRALDCAHAKGVLHLQLSPDCVEVESNDRVTVAGFGIDAAPQNRFSSAAEFQVALDEARGTKKE